MAESGTPRGPPYRDSCALLACCRDPQWWHPPHSAGRKTKGTDPGGRLAGRVFLTFRVISVSTVFISLCFNQKNYDEETGRFAPPGLNGARDENTGGAVPCRAFRDHAHPESPRVRTKAPPVPPTQNFSCFCVHSAGTGLAKFQKHFQTATEICCFPLPFHHRFFSSFSYALPF